MNGFVVCGIQSFVAAALVVLAAGVDPRRVVRILTVAVQEALYVGVAVTFRETTAQYILSARPFDFLVRPPFM